MSATQLFVYRLIPPRPSFAVDMSEEEQAVMGAHATYWRGLLDSGTAVVFGPVLDPAGVWGLAVVEAPSPDDVRAIGAADPAVSSGLASFDVLPMLGGVARA